MDSHCCVERAENNRLHRYWVVGSHFLSVVPHSYIHHIVFTGADYSDSAVVVLVHHIKHIRNIVTPQITILWGYYIVFYSTSMTAGGTVYRSPFISVNVQDTLYWPILVSIYGKYAEGKLLLQYMPEL